MTVVSLAGMLSVVSACVGLLRNDAAAGAAFTRIAARAVTARDLTGAKGPSILTWVRFHVDKEIVDLVRKGHHDVPAQLPDAELRQLLSEMRKLAGTNPAMATGGYTGSRHRCAAARIVSSIGAAAARAGHRRQQRRRPSRWPMEARAREFCSVNR